MTMRAVDISGYPKVTAPSSFGKPARLEWIAIKQLVIDPEYQREITNVGRKNIARIAAQFNWSMFTPVVVSSVGSNQYAIVDGQHRATAAALCGIDNVPCCIIEAKRGEQAAAFKAINANVTRMHKTNLFAASVMAGEVDAIRIKSIVERAQVRMLHYPKPASIMRPGETIAISSIYRIVEKFGDDIAVLALSLLANAGGGIPGALKQQPIIATAEILGRHPEWCAKPKLLRQAFSDLDIPVMLMEAFEQAARRKGVSPLNLFEAALLDAIAEIFKAAA